MRKTLYLKFLLAHLIYGIFGFLVVAVISSGLMYEHTKRDTAVSFYKEATQISQTYATDLYNNAITIESAYTQLTALAAYMNATISLVNPSGTVVLTSEHAPDVENPEIISDFDSAIVKNSYYAVDDFFGKYKEKMLIVFSPITSGYKIKGYVVIMRPIAQLQKKSDNTLGVTYVTLVMLLLLSSIFLLFFTELVYLPLRKIIKATEQYAAGNMHYELTADNNDELGYLAGTLGFMAGEIAKSEDTHKKFIANVSHDFRSPLTSIRGYLEAMLDGTIPPELHEKYLQVVLNETNRLTKLTNSLLELNNLNMKDMNLEKTEFDINNVIRNTVATFEGTCEKKQIKMNLILTGEEMLVKADMSKIQQVLYNLLDNAIKFSNNNSEIVIETRIKHSKLFVSVKDSGIGIPKESLSLIFDRFYKSDLSRGKDKKGTGLGLAITKEIIHSHGENINVVSTEGVGTEFTFTLPIVETDEI